jgi:uncharacterized membrane protein YbhN (UPF0104 family)
VLGHLRKRPVAASALATAIAAIAVLVMAHVTGVVAIGKAFEDLHLQWLALIAGTELVAYVSYTIAYRSIAQIHGHAPLALPLVARVVAAGFGPFAIGGGFGIDRQALGALQEDEQSARVRVLALGTLEWAVLAPTVCVVSIVFLVLGARILPSLLWPWAIAVPVGFGFGLWASVPARAERLARLGGRWRGAIGNALQGFGVLHTLIRKPLQYAGAWSGTALYWGADIGAFYGGLRTFGLEPGAGKVILAYATGYAATRRSLPLGGAGLTEVLMTYSLYWVGLPLAPALGAVVAYRIFNFLLAATPALIAHRQLRPILAAGGGAVSTTAPARDTCSKLFRVR